MAEKIEFEASGFQSLKAQIREANLAYQALLADVNSTPAAISAAASKVADLKDQFDDANDAVNALTGAGKFQAFTRGLAAVSGGFTALQGAITLVGGDVKDFEQTFQKLQAAMALTQGLSAMEDLGNAFGNIQKAAVGAFNGIKAAFGSTGVGAVILAATALLSALIYKFTQASDEAKTIKSADEAYKDFNTTLASTNRLMNARLGYIKETAKDEREYLVEVQKSRKEQEDDLTAHLDELSRQQAAYDSDLAFALIQGNQARIKSAQANVDATKKEFAETLAARQEAINLTTAAGNAITKYDKEQLAERSKNKKTARKEDKKEDDAAAKAEAQAEAERIKALDQRVKAELGANESSREVRLANAESESAAIQIEYENKLAKLEENYRLEQIAAAGNAEALLLIDQKYADDQILLDKEVEDKVAKAEEEADKRREEKAKEDREKADKQAQEDLEKELARRQQLQDLILDSAQTLISDLKSLNQNYDKDNEEAAKKAFEREKALSTVSALISTYLAAQKAYTSQLTLDPTSPIRAQIAAAVAIVSGLARVAVISGQRFEPSGSPSSSSSSAPQATPSTYAEGGLLTGNSHNMGGIRTSMGELEGGEFVMNRRATANFLPLLESINSIGNTPGPQVPMAAQTPIVRTYVVATDMTSQQEANARLNALARL
tara:strand:+ start:146 stop:2146 length:2001 start_codon:yes stop_codon:yes gene_type:complete